MKLPWSGRRFLSRRVLVVASVSLACVLALGSTAFGYDRHVSGLFLPGTTIGGVKVGGLSMDGATERLREDVEDPLHLPLHVTGPGFEQLTTPWELGMRVRIVPAARGALQRERNGNLLERLWHRLLGGGERSFALLPALDRARLRAFVKDAAARVLIPSANARMDAGDGWVHITPGRVGRELDLAGAERDLLHAVHTGADTVDLVTRDVQPAVPTSAFSTVVLVRAGENRLYLYKDGEIVKTYPVATGSAQYPTPSGIFRIVAKYVNPTWINPGSSWAKSMPYMIPPGPDNPLGSRAMAINADGIRIHGTPDAGSIGYSVSHGCIRMYMADAEDLFGRVPVGAPVVIVQAAPPKPRTAASGSSPAPVASPAPGVVPAPPAAPAA